MNRFKRRIESRVFRRMAHADVFELASSPKTPDLLFVFFGGSGVDDDEYVEHGKTIIPVFDHVLKSLGNCPITFVHLSAPYDVPFNRFAREPDALENWNQHVLAELLRPWDDLPFYLGSFSGGASLALNGVHQDRRCFGAAAFGADAIPRSFERPNHWERPLQLYCGLHDNVCNSPANHALQTELSTREHASIVTLRHGRHRLADYATDECLGKLLRLLAAR